MAKSATVIKGKFRPNKPVRRKLSIPTPVGTINEHWIEVIHEKDPRQAIFDNIGDIPDAVVQQSKILVAVYQPPVAEKSAGGVILTEKIKKNDLDDYFWQGKVGLIVAMGAQAYQDDDTVKFHGVKNQVGDWVWFMPSAGQACFVNEVKCRVFDSERFLHGTIPHPDYVW